MTLKLGELLLKEKMVTPEQLEEALKNQMIYGIRLGSSLVEMGIVEEEALAALLSRKLGVPCVGRQELSAIPKELIQKFPRRLAEAHQVIPLKLSGNRLSLAMTDPTDFAAIEEISFATGHIVQPYIAADVHISRALAKYFHLSIGEFRYQQIADQRRKKEKDAPPAKPATIEFPTITENGELLNVTIPAEFEGFASYHSDEPDDMFFPPGQAQRYTVDTVSLDFAGASTRDDVANVLIKYLGQEFTAAALFIIRGNAASGWCGISSGERISAFADVSLLLSKPSVLREVSESRNYFMGPLINTPENRHILKLLYLRPEVPLLVLPVVMINKVVAVVVVTADKNDFGHHLAELQKLVRKASLAFEMLIIKNKILMT